MGDFSWIYTFIRNMMMTAVPLMLVALGGMFSEKGGIMNIGLEGIMIAGGFIGGYVMTVVCTAFGMPLSEAAIASKYIDTFGEKAVVYICSMLAAMAVGIILSFALSFAAIRLKSDQTIIGTAINIFTPALCLFLAFALQLSGKANVYKIYIDLSMFRISAIPGLSKIPGIGPALFQQCYPSFFIGIVILIAACIILNLTRFGLRLKACGENPYSASAVGINVKKYRYAGTAISGALAALAGFFYVTCFASEYECDVAGYGFLGLAIMIFGNWKPSLIGLAALFFAFCQTLGSYFDVLPGASSLNVDSNLFRMIPFVVTLIVLVLMSKRSRAPKFDGVPFDEERR